MTEAAYRHSARAIFAKLGLILFGVILGLAALDGGLRLAGFVFTRQQQQHNRQQIAAVAVAERRILCLGESTTAPTVSDSCWPEELDKLLNARDYGIRFKVANEGVAGTTFAAILEKLPNQLAGYRPHIVLAMVGINDLQVRRFPLDRFGQDWAHAFGQMPIYKLLNLIGERWQRKVLTDPAANSAHGQPSSRQHENPDGNEQASPAMSSEESRQTGNDGLAQELDLCETLMQEAHYEEARQRLTAALLIQLEAWHDGFELVPEAGAEQPLETNLERTYQLIARCEATLGDDEEAEKFRRERLLRFPSLHAFEAVAEQYIAAGQLQRAEAIYLEALARFDCHPVLIYKLGRFYAMNGECSRAADMFEELERLDLPSDQYYLELARCLQAQGREKEAQQLLSTAASMKSQYYYNEQLPEYYRTLHRMVVQAGARLFLMQYPVRSVKDLQRYFEDSSVIVFISNEAPFKTAMQQRPGKQLFTDHFAGNFGHCTREGNKLIARTAAETILREEGLPIDPN